ncbi:MAG: hypothetical protein R3B40_30660 [Polyangiales bacterium]
MSEREPPRDDSQRLRGALRRALLEVEVDGQRGWVTITVGPGPAQVRAISEDGDEGGPLVEAALEALGFGDPSGALLGPQASQPPGLRRESLLPQGDARADAPLSTAGVAFEDLVTAIVRVGLDEALEAPSVEAARERLLSACATPAPLGLARFLGRLRAGLAERDPVTVTRLLDEASRFASAARQRAPSPTDLKRIQIMLGPGRDGVSSVSDCVLVELSREWVAGVERHSVERRLLVDSRSGELLVECRLQKGTASLGPCPRVLRVGLAEIESGPAPRRIHILQYEVGHALDASSFDSIAQHAERDLSALRARYQRDIKQYPGLAEPHALFAPARVDRDLGLQLCDASGDALPLRRRGDEGRSAALERACAEVSPEWVVGTLHERPEGLALDPCGVALRHDGAVRYLRLR